MLNLIGWLIKGTLFAVIILILGNKLHWGSQTISDQVRTHVSHAERSEVVDKVRGWATQLTQDARTGSEIKAKAEASAARAPSTSRDPLAEAIPPSERQKLKALIRELNSSGSRSSQN